MLEEKKTGSSQSQPGCAASPATLGSEPSAEFTPGPWRIANVHAQGMFLNNGSMVVTSDTDRICEVDCQAEFKRGAGHTAQCATRDANGRLIAAAPELLERLHWAVTAAQRLADQTPKGFLKTGISAGVAECHAAIAKATGQ